MLVLSISGLIFKLSLERFAHFKLFSGLRPHGQPTGHKLENGKATSTVKILTAEGLFGAISGHLSYSWSTLGLLVLNSAYFQRRSLAVFSTSVSSGLLILSLAAAYFHPQSLAVCSF